MSKDLKTLIDSVEEKNVEFSSLEFKIENLKEEIERLKFTVKEQKVLIAEQETLLEGIDTAKNIDKIPHDVQILKDMILQQRQELSKKDKDIDILEDQLLDLKSEKGDLWVKRDDEFDNEEVLKNKKIVIKLTEENESLKEILNDLRVEIENLKESEENKSVERAELIRSQELVVKLNEKNEALTDDIESLKIQINSLEVELNKRPESKDIIETKDYISELESNLKNLKNEVVVLNSEIEFLNQKGKKKDFKNLLNQVEDLTNQNKELQNQIEVLNTTNQASEILPSKIKGEKGKKSKKKDEKKLQAAKESNKQLTLQNNALRKKIKELEVNLKKLPVEIAEQKINNLKAKSPLDSVLSDKKESEENGEFVNSLMEDIKSLESEVLFLQQELAKRGSIKTAPIEVSKEQEETDLSQLEIITLRQKIADLTEDLEQSNQEQPPIIVDDVSNDQLMREIEELQETVIYLEQKLDKARTSDPEVVSLGETAETGADVNVKFTALIDENVSLKRQINNQNSTIDRLISEIDGHVKEISEQGKQIRKKNIKISAYETKIDSYKDRISQQNEMLSDPMARLEGRVEAKTPQSDLEITQMILKLKDRNKELEQIQNENVNYLEVLRDEVTDLNDKISLLNETIELNDNQITELENKNKELTDLSEYYKRQAKSASIEVGQNMGFDPNEDVIALKLENEKLLKDINELKQSKTKGVSNAELDDLKEQIKALRFENLRLRTEISERGTPIEETLAIGRQDDFREELEKKVKDLNKIVKDRALEIDQLMEKNRILQNMAEAPSPELEKLNEENERLNSIIEEQTPEIENLKGEITQLNEELRNQKPVVMTSKDTNELTEEISQLNNTILTLKSEKRPIEENNISTLLTLPIFQQYELFKRMYVLLNKNSQEIIIDSFINDLENNDRDRKRYAINILSEIKGEKAFNAINKLSKDKDWVIRLYVIKAFVKLRNPNAIESLKKLRNDRDPDVREAAERTLHIMSELPGVFAENIELSPNQWYWCEDEKKWVFLEIKDDGEKELKRQLEPPQEFVDLSKQLKKLNEVLMNEKDLIKKAEIFRELMEISKKMQNMRPDKD